MIDAHDGPVATATWLAPSMGSAVWAATSSTSASKDMGGVQEGFGRLVDPSIPGRWLADRHRLDL